MCAGHYVDENNGTTEEEEAISHTGPMNLAHAPLGGGVDSLKGAVQRAPQSTISVAGQFARAKAESELLRNAATP